MQENQNSIDFIDPRGIEKGDMVEYNFFSPKDEEYKYPVGKIKNSKSAEFEGQGKVKVIHEDGAIQLQTGKWYARDMLLKKGVDY
jgi:hypothetical protein